MGALELSYNGNFNVAASQRRKLYLLKLSDYPVMYYKSRREKHVSTCYIIMGAAL